MLWVLLDIAVAVLSLVVLGMVGVRLYKHVRALLHTFGTSATTLGDSSANLNSLSPRAQQQD